MQPTPERLLETTARSTFESLALLYAEPATVTAAPGADAVAARVAFAGAAHGHPAAGTLDVAVSADVAAALAANMLGAAAADAAERQDAVGEFANVVCGHVLSAAGGPAAAFRLAAPAVAAFELGARAADGPTDAAAGTGAWRVWLAVEGGHACVALVAPATLFAAGGVA
jgi:CheY-specific phosphatase CheX